ncbi:MAG: hypothetical protein IJ265_00885 [Oscillospiraceae bacterium]|nr:hypothetical protein [Oscillospiraceae bacterium]
MNFKKLPDNSKKLLDEILTTGNPSELLCEKFKKANRQEDDELRAVLRELYEEGYIIVRWADNKPYHVIINNSARTYNERLAEEEKRNSNKYDICINNNSINIGDNNKISNSQIAHSTNTDSAKKNFVEKHPVFISIITGIVTGFFLLFSFWEKIVEWIEGWF